jgi:hypothetical protein
LATLAPIWPSQFIKAGFIIIGLSDSKTAIVTNHKKGFKFQIVKSLKKKME